MRQSTIVSLVGTIAVAVSYVRGRPAGAPFPPRVDDAPGRAQFRHTARSMTATVWPLVASSFASGADAACVLPATAWMFVVWWLDVRRISPAANAADATTTSELMKQLQRGVRIEPSIITALTFGMCGLAGARAGAPYTKYIVYALVAFILVVLPYVDLALEDPLAPLVSEVQRAVLIHSIATIVTCVCLTRTSTIPAHP